MLFTDRTPFFTLESTQSRLLAFILLEHGVLALKFVFSKAIGDYSYAVKVQRARQQYLVTKHMPEREQPDIERRLSMRIRDMSVVHEEKVAEEELVIFDTEADALSALGGGVDTTDVHIVV